MKTFNNEYENKENKDRIILIKKYLSKNEIDGPKIGGTIKHIYEEYVPQISNFENLLTFYLYQEVNKSIFNYSFILSIYIIFIELLYLFFIKENNGNLWKFLAEIINGMYKYFSTHFLNDLKNQSFEEIHTSLINYIKFKFLLIYPSDIIISIQFLYNLSNFILKELYPQKLIYFIPVKIILRFQDAINCINLSFIFVKKTYALSQNKELELISKLMELNKECFRQFLSILIKIIGDQNIKNLNLKIVCVVYLEIDIEKVEYFSDKDLSIIFNFLNLMHNNSEYKKYTHDFLTKIFGDNPVLWTLERY